MRWMRWLAAIVVLLLVATIPVSDAWAKGKGRDGDRGKNGDGDKGKDGCRETPAPTPNVTAERENSVVWYVMDRNDPTRRLAGPFYIEQACKASVNGYNNAMCRAVRD